MNRAHLVAVLRWLGLIPAAMAGFAGGYVVASVLGQLAPAIGIIGEPGSDGLWRHLIWIVPMGVPYVLAGARMAPRFQVCVAMLLAVHWTVWTSSTHRWYYGYVTASIAGAAMGVLCLLCLAARRSRLAVTKPECKAEVSGN